ncbi:MAG: response regulator transcription factor [Sulfurifustaceae bacterium]
MPNQPTVFVVDDDLSVRRSLSRLLQSVGYRVKDFASAKEFLQNEADRNWGCLVLDVQLPQFTGLELQQALPQAPLSIVFITGHGSVPISVQAMKHGAVDFLEKPLKAGELLRAVESALTRSREEYQEQLADAAVRARLSLLTPREYQVLCGVVAGKLNKQIAADLGVGEKTIKVHRGRVMKKMGARSVASLVQAVSGNLRVSTAPAVVST